MRKNKVEDLVSGRKTRKSCYEKTGDKTFHFKLKEEKIIYKYICGDKLTINEWRKCKKNYIPKSYSQWREYISKKYCMYTKKQLEEFERYLRVGVRNCNTWVGFNNIVFAAVISAAVSVMFSWLTDTVGVAAIQIAEMLLVLFFPALFSIAICYWPIERAVVKQKFYEDYIEIIHSMIEQKNNE